MRGVRGSWVWDTALHGCAGTAPAAPLPRRVGCPSAPRTWGGWGAQQGRGHPLPTCWATTYMTQPSAHTSECSPWPLRSSTSGARYPGVPQSTLRGGHCELHAGTPTAPCHGCAHPQCRPPAATCRASPRSPIFTCISMVTSKLPAGGHQPESSCSRPPTPVPCILGLRSRCTMLCPWR